MPQWIWTDEPVELGSQRDAVREAARRNADGIAAKSAMRLGGFVRAARDGIAAAAAKLTNAEKTTSEPVESVEPSIQEARVAADQEYHRKAAQSKAAGRHKVVFRKKFTLPAWPAEAYATLLASQSFELQVNGRPAEATVRDKFRNGRIAIFDLHPLLVAGENVIVIDVSSHTEKDINDEERQQFPASADHLNQQSGVAFLPPLRAARRGANRHR